MLWPQREVLTQLMREDQTLIHEETKPYLRDSYDHTVQIMDLFETYRDMAASMLDGGRAGAGRRRGGGGRGRAGSAARFGPPAGRGGGGGGGGGGPRSPGARPE